MKNNKKNIGFILQYRYLSYPIYEQIVKRIKNDCNVIILDIDKEMPGKKAFYTDKYITDNLGKITSLKIYNNKFLSKKIKKK